MNAAIFIPIVAIMATAWVIISVMHYRSGGRGIACLGDMSPSAPSISEARENARLAHENEALRLTIERLEDRLAVLERIATDPAERTAREIEALR